MQGHHPTPYAGANPPVRPIKTVGTYPRVRPAQHRPVSRVRPPKKGRPPRNGLNNRQHPAVNLQPGLYTQHHLGRNVQRAADVSCQTQRRLVLAAQNLAEMRRRDTQHGRGGALRQLLLVQTLLDGILQHKLRRRKRIMDILIVGHKLRNQVI